MPQRPCRPPVHVPAAADSAHATRRRYGVPSQDPDPRAQVPLQGAEQLRELQSVFTGGGLLAGLALGTTAGMLLAGAVGVLPGSVVGALAGVWAGMGLVRSVLASAGAVSGDGHSAAPACHLLD